MGFSGTEHGTAENPGGFVAQKKTPVGFNGTEHGTAEKCGGF